MVLSILSICSIVTLLLLLMGASAIYLHNYSIRAYTSLNGHNSYLLPLSKKQRAHNHERSIERKIEEHTRWASTCQELAKAYAREGDEITAAVLLVQADDAVRRKAMHEADLRGFQREIALAQRERSIHTLTKRMHNLATPVRRPDK